jgi:recombination protein RecA
MSQSLRKLTGALSKSNCTAIFINQLRDKIGVMYGSSETTTGGRALKFYASVRIDVRRVESIKVGGEVVGNRTKAKIVKNKIAPPFKEAEFDIMYGKGISKEGEIVDTGLKLGILTRSGAWFYYGETRIGQGRDNVKQLLLDNPELMKELEEKITALMAEKTAKVETKASAPAPVAAPAEEASEEPRRRKKVNIDIAVDE